MHPSSSLHAAGADNQPIEHKAKPSVKTMTNQQINAKTEIIPDASTRAKMAINLSNKFKAKAVAHEGNETLLFYANLLWATAYESGACSLVYEDAGDNAYYDLAGISIGEGEAYACIPVPLLQPTVIAEFMKKQPKMVEKKDHRRQGIPYSWEELMPEFVFLCLYPEMQIADGRRAWDDLWVLWWDKISSTLLIEGMEQKIRTLPSNPVVYDARSSEHTPIHDGNYHQWVKYGTFYFKTFKNLASIFEAVS